MILQVAAPVPVSEEEALGPLCLHCVLTVCFRQPSLPFQAPVSSVRNWGREQLLPFRLLMTIVEIYLEGSRHSHTCARNSGNSHLCRGAELDLSSCLSVSSTPGGMPRKALLAHSWKSEKLRAFSFPCPPLGSPLLETNYHLLPTFPLPAWGNNCHQGESLS